MWRPWHLVTGLIPVLALAAPVVPDRPGFSTGTATLSPGAWQVEMGIQSSYGNRAGDPDSYTAPLLNLRRGLGPATEFNLLWDGVQVMEGGDEVTADPMFGAKHRLVTQDRYNISLLGYLSWQDDRLAPFLGLLWDRALTADVGLFGTLQVATGVEQGRLETYFQPAVGLSFAHGEQLGSFIEIYAERRLAAGSKTATVVDAGLAWLPKEDLQLDLNFGFSLDRRSDDFIGIGLAVRY